MFQCFLKDAHAATAVQQRYNKSRGEGERRTAASGGRGGKRCLIFLVLCSDWHSVVHQSRIGIQELATPTYEFTEREPQRTHIFSEREPQRRFGFVVTAHTKLWAVTTKLLRQRGHPLSERLTPSQSLSLSLHTPLNTPVTHLAQSHACSRSSKSGTGGLCYKGIVFFYRNLSFHRASQILGASSL